MVGGGVDGTRTDVEGRTPSDVAALVCAYPWPCEWALAVVACESSWDPRAYNEGNYGLFQVHYLSHVRRVDGPPEILYDPEVNVKMAYEIWSENGAAPWPNCP